MPQKSEGPQLDPIGHNTEAILAFNLHEQGTLSLYRRFLVHLGDGIGSPIFLAITVLFTLAWIICNSLGSHFHFLTFDPPPFSILQGVIGMGSLITTMIVLIKQNRLGRMEERRAYLELQVNLLTEQKATKLINLIEELRHDLPMIKNRYDAEAMALQVPTDPETVLKALDDRLEL